MLFCAVNLKTLYCFYPRDNLYECKFLYSGFLRRLSDCQSSPFHTAFVQKHNSSSDRCLCTNCCSSVGLMKSAGWLSVGGFFGPVSAHYCGRSSAGSRPPFITEDMSVCVCPLGAFSKLRSFQPIKRQPVSGGLCLPLACCGLLFVEQWCSSGNMHFLSNTLYSGLDLSVSVGCCINNILTEEFFIERV